MLVRSRFSRAIAFAVIVLCCSQRGSADQVILDDLIVDGSICAGFDCVNGESFGFDTLRLKENNMRIRAVDTSTTSSFPSRDWQITFNDSANGGADKFSIDDIDGGRTPFTIEAGAPSHSLYVEDGGRLGLGTSTPVTDIHVKSGNTPTLRLEQDGSSGFGAQTWDVAGNEANFFIRDATSGSTLPFRVFPGAPSNALNIEGSTGDIGLGTTSPEAVLHVAGNASTSETETEVLVRSGADARIQIESLSSSARLNLAADTNAGGKLWNLVAGTNDVLQVREDGTFSHPPLTIESGGFVGLSNENPAFPLEIGTDNSDGNGAHVTTGGMFTNASSREFKQGIRDLGLDEATDAVMNLNPVRYEYKTEPGEEYVGFIAEDVPALVATESRKYLAAMDIVASLTKVVQQQQTTVKQQHETITKLSERVKDLERDWAAERE